MTYPDIFAGLSFAKRYLKINGPLIDSHVVCPYDATRNWLGRYDPIVRLIEFNGIPLWDTIFHESVHYWQHERGDDLETSYLNMKTFGDYWMSPFEIEARELSAQMMEAYFPPERTPWERFHGGFGLRSDHTYY